MHALVDAISENGGKLKGVLYSPIRWRQDYNGQLVGTCKTNSATDGLAAKKASTDMVTIMVKTGCGGKHKK